jgi:hypothetical protein
VAWLPARLAARRPVRPLRLLRPVARRRLRRVLRRAARKLLQMRQAAFELGDPRVALGELPLELGDPFVAPIRRDPSSVKERGAASSCQRNRGTDAQSRRDDSFQRRA